MAVNLLTPILSTRTRSINFFNGRLLAAEDLTTEQQNNRAAHRLLGNAIGDRVVSGLEVSISALSNTVANPVIAINQGLAINRSGTTLLLDSNTEIVLVQPATPAATSTTIFQDCAPAQAGPYIAGAGVYLLTIGPAAATEGLAEVSGLNNSQASCNTKYNTQGVQFRLIPVPLTEDELDDTNRLRNLVAYKCFGTADQTSFLADPWKTQLTSYGLLDQLRATQTLTNCDVPLAILYWTADQGIAFVDMWSVRRAITAQDVVAAGYPLLIGDRHRREAQAEFLQFEDQAQSLLAASSSPSSVVVDDYFSYLPATGILPVIGNGSLSGFDPGTFFGAHASKDVATIDADRIPKLLYDGLYEQPIQLSPSEKVQLYLIWENLQSVSQGTSNQLVLVFATSALSYRGIARFGTAKWTLSRFAPRVI